MVAFNNTVGLPIAQSKVRAEIDGIKFDATIYISLDNHFPKEILLGHEILALPDVKAVYDASGIKFEVKFEVDGC